ncbi:MAG: diacylglycerol/lipid kinase family protein [Betaproteobacteria bacterium]
MAGARHGREEAERISRAFREAGRPCKVELLGKGDSPREAALRAMQARPPLVIAAGGDGTLGRGKRSAMLWATLAVLDRPPLLELRLDLDDGPRDCAAPFVFVGNNGYVLEGFDVGHRERIDAGVLTVYTTRSCTAGGLLVLALRALAGRLRQAEDFVESSARSLRVASRRPRLLVATDGEVRVLETPLEFRLRPRALQVIVP